jgi:2-polyprenyl-6-methoxyphenol hydroxylase-like FAD-dependent oxidoreductase
VETQDCVVVGGGPGGTVLAYLLARQGLRVALLEARGDFARRFRGDSLAPAVMDWLDELGLGDDVLARPHAVADGFTWHSPSGSYRLADYSTASRRHPHYVLVPQVEFLDLLAERAAAFPGSTLAMSARVTELVEERGRVAGVRYRVGGGEVREVRAPLVVGADGRFSQTRRLGGFAVEELGAGLDILWFEVPRRPDDPPLSGLDYFSAPGRAVVALGQGRAWQLGYIIPTGTVAQAREAGVGPVVALTREQLPWLGDRLDGLTDFSQLTLLNVRITRLPSWYRPGLLLLGDAAHVISPVGGNGINIAVADAADAGNTLAGPLASADPAAIDAAARAFEVRRRAVSDAEQRGQVRTERASVARLRRGDPEPLALLKVAARIRPLARFVGRRSARAIAIPAPSPALLAAVRT